MGFLTGAGKIYSTVLNQAGNASEHGGKLLGKGLRAVAASSKKDPRATGIIGTSLVGGYLVGKVAAGPEQEAMMYPGQFSMEGLLSDSVAAKTFYYMNKDLLADFARSVPYYSEGDEPSEKDVVKIDERLRKPLDADLLENPQTNQKIGQEYSNIKKKNPKAGKSAAEQAKKTVREELKSERLSLGKQFNPETRDRTIRKAKGRNLALSPANDPFSQVPDDIDFDVEVDRLGRSIRNLRNPEVKKLREDVNLVAQERDIRELYQTLQDSNLPENKRRELRDRLIKLENNRPESSQLEAAKSRVQSGKKGLTRKLSNSEIKFPSPVKRLQSAYTDIDVLQANSVPSSYTYPGYSKKIDKSGRARYVPDTKTGKYTPKKYEQGNSTPSRRGFRRLNTTLDYIDKGNWDIPEPSTDVARERAKAPPATSGPKVNAEAPRKGQQKAQQQKTTKQPAAKKAAPKPSGGSSSGGGGGSSRSYSPDSKNPFQAWGANRGLTKSQTRQAIGGGALLAGGAAIVGGKLIAGKISDNNRQRDIERKLKEEQ